MDSALPPLRSFAIVVSNFFFSFFFFFFSSSFVDVDPEDCSVFQPPHQPPAADLYIIITNSIHPSISIEGHSIVVIFTRAFSFPVGLTWFASAGGLARSHSAIPIRPLVDASPFFFLPYAFFPPLRPPTQPHLRPHTHPTLNRQIWPTKIMRLLPPRQCSLTPMHHPRTKMLR